jgi:hypothetical protein
MTTSFKKISVLVPSRRRLPSLQKMIDSFGRTVTNPEQAELVFRCDNDDPKTIDLIRGTAFRFIVGPRADGYKSLPTFYNEMAGIASGDVFMCCNDDVEFRTVGWSQMILDEANHYPDGIFNIGVSVGLNDDKFPFSVVSRMLCEAMGCLNDPRLLFSDVFLLDVARYFGRAISLPSVSIVHDWAGHRDDATRREANHHEFALVFKDTHGNWSDAYLNLHQSVVREAIGKIRRSSSVVADLAINSLIAYRPPIAGSAGIDVWPPRVRCPDWNGAPAPGGVPYAKSEISQVIRTICQLGIDSGRVLLTSFGNGLTSVLWGSVFDAVTVVCPDSTSRPPLVDGKYTVCFGSIGEASSMLKLAGEIGAVRGLVIDESRYASAMSSYFTFRHHIERPGIVVFSNTGPDIVDDDGTRRFVNELRAGFVDGRRHEIVDVEPASGGPGMTYELT